VVGSAKKHNRRSGSGNLTTPIEEHRWVRIIDRERERERSRERERERSREREYVKENGDEMRVREEYKKRQEMDIYI
jgi:hypothetical protein